MAILLAGVTIPSFAEGDDPLVSLSYLNQRLQAIEAKIGTSSGGVSSSSALEVVNLKAGERLIAAQGTEMIPRSGRVTVIASELGGLSDITAAKDIVSGEKAPANHLLIAPRSDGRGLSAKSDAIVMVRGSYRVQP